MQISERSIGSTAAIEVDLMALQRLAADLGRLSEEFAGGGQPVGLIEPELAAALEHAERDWRHHRDQLAGFLHSASDAVRSSAAAYRQADDSVAAAARPRQ